MIVRPVTKLLGTVVVRLTARYHERKNGLAPK